MSYIIVCKQKPISDNFLNAQCGNRISRLIFLWNYLQIMVSLCVWFSIDCVNFISSVFCYSEIADWNCWESIVHIWQYRRRCPPIWRFPKLLTMNSTNLNLKNVLFNTEGRKTAVHLLWTSPGSLNSFQLKIPLTYKQYREDYCELTRYAVINASNDNDCLFFRYAILRYCDTALLEYNRAETQIRQTTT